MLCPTWAPSTPPSWPTRWRATTGRAATRPTSSPAPMSTARRSSVWRRSWVPVPKSTATGSWPNSSRPGRRWRSVTTASSAPPTPTTAPPWKPCGSAFLPAATSTWPTTTACTAWGARAGRPRRTWWWWMATSCARCTAGRWSECASRTTSFACPSTPTSCWRCMSSPVSSGPKRARTKSPSS